MFGNFLYLQKVNIVGTKKFKKLVGIMLKLKSFKIQLNFNTYNLCIF